MMPASKIYLSPLLLGLLGLNLALMGVVIFRYWGQGMVLSSAFLVMSLGLRHAFDADHIAAIDGATRKFLAQDQVKGNQPQWRLSLAGKIGGYFAIGHSLMMFILVITVVAIKHVLVGSAIVGEECLNGWCGILSDWAVMLILYALAVSNLWVAVRLWRHGRQTDRHRKTGGWLSRGLQKIWGFNLQPYHMVLIGLVFGLGFDTATEVAMVKIAADAASQNTAWLNWLIFPALFGASMGFADAMNGTLMGRVFQTSPEARTGSSPPTWRHRLSFNLMVTLLSGLVALAVATHRLLLWLHEHTAFDQSQPAATSGFWYVLDVIDRNWAGLGVGVAVMFMILWLGFGRAKGKPGTDLVTGQGMER